jgi:hypothetical protein
MERRGDARRDIGATFQNWSWRLSSSFASGCRGNNKKLISRRLAELPFWGGGYHAEFHFRKGKRKKLNNRTAPFMEGESIIRIGITRARQLLPCCISFSDGESRLCML